MKSGCLGADGTEPCLLIRLCDVKTRIFSFRLSQHCDTVQTRGVLAAVGGGPCSGSLRCSRRRVDWLSLGCGRHAGRLPCFPWSRPIPAGPCGWTRRAEAGGGGRAAISSYILCCPLKPSAERRPARATTDSQRLSDRRRCWLRGSFTRVQPPTPEISTRHRTSAPAPSPQVRRPTAPSPQVSQLSLCSPSPLSVPTPSS